MVLTIIDKELRAIPVPVSRKLAGEQLTITVSLLLPVKQAWVHTHLMHTSCDRCVTRINSNASNQISSEMEIRKPYWPSTSSDTFILISVLRTNSWCLFHTTEKNRGPLEGTVGMSNTILALCDLGVFLPLIAWYDRMQCRSPHRH